MDWYMFLKIVAQVLITGVVVAVLAALGKAVWDQIKPK